MLHLTKYIKSTTKSTFLNTYQQEVQHADHYEKKEPGSDCSKAITANPGLHVLISLV